MAPIISFRRLNYILKNVPRCVNSFKVRRQIYVFLVKLSFFLFGKTLLTFLEKQYDHQKQSLKLIKFKGFFYNLLP